METFHKYVNYVHMIKYYAPIKSCYKTIFLLKHYSHYFANQKKEQGEHSIHNISSLKIWRHTCIYF